MSAKNLVGLVIAGLLLAYLGATLIFPERF